MIATLLALAASVAFLVVAFVPLERAFPARRQAILRREWWIDLAFLVGQYLLWNGISIALLRVVTGALHAPLGGVHRATALCDGLAFQRDIRMRLERNVHHFKAVVLKNGISLLTDVAERTQEVVPMERPAGGIRLIPRVV